MEMRLRGLESKTVLYKRLAAKTDLLPLAAKNHVPRGQTYFSTLLKNGR